MVLFATLVTALITGALYATFSMGRAKGAQATRCDFCHDPLLWLRLQGELSDQPSIEFSVNDLLSMMCLQCAKVNVSGVRLLEHYGVLDSEGVSST